MIQARPAGYSGMSMIAYFLETIGSPEFLIGVIRESHLRRGGATLAIAGRHSGQSFDRILKPSTHLEATEAIELNAHPYSKGFVERHSVLCCYSLHRIQ